MYHLLLLTHLFRLCCVKCLLRLPVISTDHPLYQIFQLLNDDDFTYFYEKSCNIFIRGELTLQSSGIMVSSEQEFLQKMEKHKGIIFKISKMYMDSRDDRDDLFQEITYQVWKAYPNFKGQSEFSTWLYRIALNTAIVFLKTEKKRNWIRQDDFSGYAIAQEEFDPEKEEKLSAMYRAIRQLSPIDKAFIFYYLEDVSGKEIAGQMGISEGNVRVKMNRAKNRLREILQHPASKL